MTWILIKILSNLHNHGFAKHTQINITNVAVELCLSQVKLVTAKPGSKQWKVIFTNYYVLAETIFNIRCLYLTDFKKEWKRNSESQTMRGNLLFCQAPMRASTSQKENKSWIKKLWMVFRTCPWPSPTHYRHYHYPTPCNNLIQFRSHSL